LLTDDPQHDGFERVFELIMPLAISALWSLGVTLDPANGDTLGRDFIVAMKRGSGQHGATSLEHENG